MAPPARGRARPGARRATRRLAEALRGMSRTSSPAARPPSGQRGPRRRARRWRLALEPSPWRSAPTSPAGLRVEVVATGIPRPIQLALDARGRLVVLSHGWRGDAAGRDLSGRPWTPRCPWTWRGRPAWWSRSPTSRGKTVLGSLAIDPPSGDLFLGEENGNRIYRLGADQRLQAVAVGLNHLLGGSALALDRHGTARVPRLREHGDASQIGDARCRRRSAGSSTRAIAGPWSSASTRARSVRCPGAPTSSRRSFRRRGAQPGGPASLVWRLIGVAPVQDDLVLLSVVGEVFRLGSDGELHLITRLPGRTLPPDEPDDGARWQRVRVRRVPDPPDLPDLAGRLGEHRGERAGRSRRHRRSTARALSTSRRPPYTASSASRPPGADKGLGSLAPRPGAHVRDASRPGSRAPRGKAGPRQRTASTAGGAR